MIGARAQFTPRSGLGQFIPAVVGPAVIASVEAACVSIQQAAQGYCPVDTGALRDSITVEVVETDRSVVGRVGPHIYYADFVEYGTGQRGDPAAPYPHRADWTGMVAKPYMRPALDEVKPAILDLFRGNISSAIT